MHFKNRYAVVQLFALWELVWILAAVFGYSDASHPWLFPLAATLAGAPIVAVAVFFAATKLSLFANRKETKKSPHPRGKPRGMSQDTPYLENR